MYEKNENHPVIMEPHDLASLSNILQRRFGSNSFSKERKAGKLKDLSQLNLANYNPCPVL